jgi:hypothetical protein
MDAILGILTKPNVPSAIKISTLINKEFASMMKTIAYKGTKKIFVSSVNKDIK